MKKIILLLAVACSLTSCYTTSMQGSPAAVSAGASIGGVLGSIVGDRAGGWQGSQFGALVGTVAGAAIGNAVTTPRQEKVVVEGRYPERIPLGILLCSFGTSDYQYPLYRRQSQPYD